jgi:cyclohexanone monooxygenase
VWGDTTSAGSLTADIVIAASGGLSEPRMPDIDGLDSFSGDLFHSARWNHDVDLTGKRVAVIGTGASAIQIIPQVAKVAEHVDVYQRTPAWVMARNDREYTSLEHWAFEHVPGFQRMYRAAVYFGLEARVPMFTRFPQVAQVASKMALANMHKSIHDPELREKLTPTYTMGCKRILISNDYYPALAQDNVEVVTDGIAEITPSGVVTKDGTEREIDVLIVATGFYTTEIPITEHIYGRDGVQLAKLWEEQGTAAYKGTTIHGFPNYFHIVGPNTGLGHSSMVFIIESQIAYIHEALAEMERRRARTAEVTAAAQQGWNEALQRDMQKTVWNTGGCSSWYLDDHGRNVTLWPYTTMRFRYLLSRFDPSKYTLRARPAVRPDQTEEEKVSA